MTTFICPKCGGQTMTYNDASQYVCSSCDCCVDATFGHKETEPLRSQHWITSRYVRPDPPERPAMRLSLSVQALERLIGGDGPLEVDLRTQVVEQFLKKHLTKFFSTAAFQEIETVWKREAMATAAEVVGQYVAKKAVDRYGGTTAVFELAPGLKPALVQMAKDAMSAEIHEYTVLYRATTMAKLFQEFDRKIERAVDDDIKGRVEKEVQRRLLLAASLPAPAPNPAA